MGLWCGNIREPAEEGIKNKIKETLVIREEKTYVITDGRRPRCRGCGQIGHLLKMCEAIERMKKQRNKKRKWRQKW